MRDQPPGYTSIAELAARAGKACPCAGNLPVALDEPDHVWFIAKGSVDLFLVELRDGVEQASPQHLLRREAGELLPGVAPDSEGDDTETTLGLLAKGLPDTLLMRLPVSLLHEVDPAELAQQTDTWLQAITETLSRFVGNIPHATALAEPGVTRSLESCVLSVRQGVVWVSLPSHGAGLYMDMVEPEAGGHGDILVPLTRTSWLTFRAGVTVSGTSSQALAEQGALLPALATFHAAALALERLNRQLAVVDEANLERARIASRRTAEHDARQKLFNMYDTPIGDDVGDTALADALKIIGRHQGIDFRIPPRHASGSPPGLTDILDASGVRARRLKISPDNAWWRGDSSAILAFRSADDRPVVLLPGLFGHYREVDPASGRSARVAGERAGGLKAEAWMFYRPLPSRPVKPADLLEIAFKGSGADLARLLVTGLCGGLIKLLPALALGFVAHQAMAGGTAGVLYVVALTLAGFGLLGALLQLLQSTILMRLEGRSASRVEAAFWDRLMRLPPAVLRRQPTGDLAMSGMTFQNVRDGLQGVVSDSLLSILFLVPVLGITFFYDTSLGLVVLAFSLLSLLVTVVLGLRQLAPQGRMISAARRVTGRLFQIIGGIAKLRVESAEGSAFAIWAGDYRRQKRAELEVHRIEEHVRAFGAALPFFAGAVLLFAVAAFETRTLPIGDFLVVFMVFIASQSAVARLGESVGAVAALAPAFRQMRPLLAAVPEAGEEGALVERLGGEILFDHVSFRYEPEGPLVLDDVTIHVRPGEFVAIAGESGAGKSTLFQLALGIDQPTSGAVYYDGRDLKHLNLKQVRRKIGTVPQAVRLHPQDIWDNIVAHHEGVGPAEVWEAARAAGIEGGIKAMLMGMMTMVGGSGSVLSGGESQRVTIARSLVGDRRIMLLDEATNWLDNDSQAEVMQNLALLTTTRLVIAHRLSTLEKADCIHVLKAGKIVESGSFSELMDIDGVFRNLVRRQIA
ncbi:MAG: ATP-binding cassette domain-containing protein [bacterium]|nr:ATP-binding cassette domain-containing protein [bacterium]MDE0240373.1 ATP-binding cassette domain-containing protein [bacterium]